MARAHLARPTDSPPAAHDTAPGPGSIAHPTTPLGEPPLLPPDELPRHVAIIMDGNRRWARQRDLPELDGHAAGVEAIRALLRHAVRRGVPVMTLYAFSRENWARSDEEVTGLFGLLEAAIRSETAEPRRASDPPWWLDQLPAETRASIADAPRRPRTASGRPEHRLQPRRRTELVDALDARGKRIAPEDNDEATIGAAPHVGLPDPDPSSDGRRAAPVELPHLAIGLRGVLFV